MILSRGWAFSSWGQTGYYPISLRMYIYQSSYQHVRNYSKNRESYFMKYLKSLRYAHTKDFY